MRSRAKTTAGKKWRCSEMVDHSRNGVRDNFQCTRSAPEAGGLCTQHAKVAAERERDRETEVLRSRLRQRGKLKKADAERLAELEAATRGRAAELKQGDRVTIDGKVAMTRKAAGRPVPLVAVSVVDAQGRTQLIEMSADQLGRARGGRRAE